MIVVTGGAGFIGSCIVGMLNAYGYEDIINDLADACSVVAPGSRVLVDAPAVLD